MASFPVAGRSGIVSYQRTIAVPDNVSQRLADMHVVVHGHDLNGSGSYDGALSSLSSVIGAPVPLEAELPVACGALSGSSRTFG